VNVEKVLLASPRGFCAGVEMAIKALDWMLKIFNPPIYCYHEIVHNKIVVDHFKNKGVIFVDDISLVPENSPLILSAHGSPPEVENSAHDKGRIVVNAVCPLVTKVHHEVKTRAERGYKILYVGHPNHEESIGTMAVAPGSITLVQRVADLEPLNIDPESPVALLAQTTLSHDEWRAILEAAKSKYPQLWMPARGDLCFATTNRQRALKAIAPLVNSIIVIGSANSSNTLALTRVATNAGCERVYRINEASELPENLEGIVGLTAGASGPEHLVQEVLDKLNPRQGVETINVTEEDEYFPPPRELRDLLKGLSAAVGLGVLKTDQLEFNFTSDREMPARSTLTSSSLNRA
jgi:4-hydroxy-3-methylbut-2-enyl diphosphate reductase